VRLSSWLLVRKLYRRTPSEVVTSVTSVCLVRMWAAACAFGSMLLVGWISAFARAVFRHGWSGGQTLSTASFANASAQAGRGEGDLVPVLVVWAALLLLTPTGYTIAFRCAVMAAGALGALDFTPPAFVVTREVAGFSQDLAQFAHSWNAIMLLSVGVAAASVLHQGALRVFSRLDEISARRKVRPSRVIRFALALVVLLLATWSGTVVWLAASHRDAVSYGVRGGLVLSDYLLVLAIVAVLVASSDNAQGRLLALMPLAAALGAIANVSPIPRDLMFSLEREGLERIGSAFGGSSLWAALFICFPACLLGLYLVAPVRR
jgi:hypothetical protein